VLLKIVNVLLFWLIKQVEHQEEMIIEILFMPLLLNNMLKKQILKELEFVYKYYNHLVKIYILIHLLNMK